MTTKTCGKCKLEKDLDEFYVRNAKGYKHGRSSQCIECEKLRQKAQHARLLEDPDYKKRSSDYQRQRTFNITPERYWQMVEDQAGVCAICLLPDKSRNLSVDHDHSCCPGKTSCGECVRGLLCNVCNSLEGQLARDMDRTMRLLAYMGVQT